MIQQRKIQGDEVDDNDRVP